MRSVRLAQRARRNVTSKSYMQAVAVRNGNVQVITRPKPVPANGEHLMKVVAAGVNRADLLQSQGKYPPPPGACETLGLEAAGSLEDGRVVCALLSSGAFAEYALVPDYAILKLPISLSPVQMAAIPEAFIAAHHILFQLGNFKPEQSVLIHAGASGVGTALIQLAAQVPRAHIIASAGTEQKLELCKTLGAHTVINYKDDRRAIVERVMETTNGTGVDLVLDCVGATAFKQNVKSIRTDGTWVLYGLLSGAKHADLNLARLLTKRVKLLCTTLRGRSAEFKKSLISQFSERHGSSFESGRLRPIIAQTFNGLTSVEHAFRYMQNNLNIGKIVIKVNPEDS